MEVEIRFGFYPTPCHKSEPGGKVGRKGEPSERCLGLSLISVRGRWIEEEEGKKNVQAVISREMGFLNSLGFVPPITKAFRH